MKPTDVAIVGAGIAGAGLAAALAPHASVLLIEAEDMPGRHATGRSAAFWTESYGGPDVRPLTSASGPWLAECGYLRPRGALHIGRDADAPLFESFRRDFAEAVELRDVDPATIVPGLRAEYRRAIVEPSCADIDVARLHADLLAEARRHGAALATGQPLESAERQGGVWHLRAGGEEYRAALLVNAAGAWADAVAEIAGVRPIGIRPYRRTIVQLRTDPPAPNALPLVIDIAGKFYFKPDAGGRVWLSPHDESPVDAGDAAAEEIDVATAIDRFQRVVDWRVARVEHRWAGLRSFAPDRLPVYGHDPRASGLFWCVGQGGFGIQTAPAASALAAALILGSAPDPLAAAIDPARYAPDRPSLTERP